MSDQHRDELLVIAIGAAIDFRQEFIDASGEPPGSRHLESRN
jgi:hypothetical protein